MGAGEALRRVLECLGSGILLAGMCARSLIQITPVGLLFVLKFF